MNKELCGFLDGWQEASGAEDMPDGAWQCVMMEGVEAYNTENNTKFDPHEGWLYWIQHREDDIT
jgi:hypothetical protein